MNGWVCVRVISVNSHWSWRGLGVGVRATRFFIFGKTAPHVTSSFAYRMYGNFFLDFSCVPNLLNSCLSVITLCYLNYIFNITILRSLPFSFTLLLSPLSSSHFVIFFLSPLPFLCPSKIFIRHLFCFHFLCSTTIIIFFLHLHFLLLPTYTWVGFHCSLFSFYSFNAFFSLEFVFSISFLSLFSLSFISSCYTYFNCY